MLLFLAIMGSCSKNSLTVEVVDGVDTTAAITLGTTVSWATKGTSVDQLSDVKELTLYSFDAYGEDGTLWESATTLSPFFTDDPTVPLTLTTSDDGKTWDYTATTGGLRYWRGDNAEAVTFFALYPASELDVTFDETSGKPEFSYSQSEFAGENDDLVIDAFYDLNNSKVTDGKVEFLLEHALAKLTLNASITGECVEDAAYDNVKYEVNGLTINNLRGGGTLEIDSDGSTRWVLNETNISLTATQGVTLLAIDDEGAELSENSQSVMFQNQAIFVLPQDLAEDATEDDGDAPTIVIRIRKTFDSNSPISINPDVSDWTDVTNTPSLTTGTTTTTTEVIYETEEIEIPAATVGDNYWEAGTHYALSFVFDISKLSEYDTPLTLTSTIYGWSETTVDVDVHQNLYFYADDQLIEVGSEATYADFRIYTNYEYDMRRQRRKYELDGTSYTESAGFTYYLTNATWDDTGVALEPVLLWNNNGSFSSGSDYVYSTLTEYEYNYRDGVLYAGDVKVELDDEGYMDPTQFEDSDGWMYFVLQPDPDNSATDFYYKVKRTTRAEEGLYTNTSVGDDTSYGINKKDEDAVYTLRLNISDAHLMKEDGTTVAEKGDEFGYFYGKVGAEAISNGGGLVTNKFKMMLQKTLNNE